MKVTQSGYEGLYQMIIGETLSIFRKNDWIRRVNLLMENMLSKREVEVLKLRFDLINPASETRIRSQQEVGDRLGLSKERIHQIEDDVMRRWRFPVSRRFLFFGKFPKYWTERRETASLPTLGTAVSLLQASVNSHPHQIKRRIMSFFMQAYGIGVKISESITITLIQGDAKCRQRKAMMIRNGDGEGVVNEFIMKGRQGRDKYIRNIIINCIVSASTEEREQIALLIEDWEFGEIEIDK